MGLFKKTKTTEAPVQELDSVESKNALVGEQLGVTNGHVFGDDIKRKKGETQQEYNERVPVALQPAGETPKYSYLGNKL